MDRVYVMELVRAFQCGYMTRREFVTRSGIALGGFVSVSSLLAACSASPANPRPVVATPSGAPPEPTAAATAGATAGTALGGATSAASAPRRGSMVTYAGPKGQPLSGYLALPEGGKAAPGVVVIQEWWGVNDQIKGVADRLAEAGYVALAPDLYHGVVTTEPDEARKQVMALDMANAVAEIHSAAGFLGTRPEVANPKVGVMGFCMGGMLALQAAVGADDLGAVTAFYGKPPKAEDFEKIKTPVLGLYGATDQSIKEPEIRAMEAALKQAGIPVAIRIYDGAGHAFFNETATSYNAPAATDAWPLALAWFQQHLAQSAQ